MGPTLILAVAMALPMGGGHGHACQTCNQCDNCGHHGFLHKGGFWARRGLPAPCHAPGNMMLHLPYHTANMRYYYFRPYNYMHIAEQQAEAVSIGLPPGQPYSNAVFKQVYAEMELRYPETVPAPEPPPAPVNPGEPVAPPAPAEPDSPLDSAPAFSPLESRAKLGTRLTLIP